MLEGIEPTISAKQNQILDVAFTKEEIERVLKQMHPTKAPGLDGAHALFFQYYWDIIGSDVTNICLNILNTSLNMDNLNYSFDAMHTTSGVASEKKGIPDA